MILLALACEPVLISLGESELAQDTGGIVENIGDAPPSGIRADTAVDSIFGEEGELGPDSDQLFDLDELLVFSLEIPADSYNALLSDPYEYVEATLTYDGVSYGPIGVRTKGENSWRPINEKSSLKLDFNRYEGGPERFYGLKGLTLNAMNEDYSMMHERVAYWLYRSAGVPAARAHHARVYLNGEYYGLFTAMDTVDDKFLERWFEDPTGSLFEQHDGDFTDDYVQNNDYFQLEEGDGDRSALQAVADALESTGPSAIEEAGEHLNWESFQRYWAVGSVVMNFDAYPFRFAGDDCHVYHDPITDQLHYIPHGVDETFYYNYNVEDQALGHLSDRCKDVAYCRDAWARIVYDVLDVVDEMEMVAYAEFVRDQIADAASEDENRNYSMSYVTYYQGTMIDSISSRRSEIASQIGPRPEE